MRGALSDSGLGALKNPSRKSFKSSKNLSIKTFSQISGVEDSRRKKLSTIAKHKVRNPDPRLGAGRATSRPNPNAAPQVAQPRDPIQTRRREALAHRRTSGPIPRQQSSPIKE